MDDPVTPSSVVLLLKLLLRFTMARCDRVTLLSQPSQLLPPDLNTKWKCGSSFNKCLKCLLLCTWKGERFNLSNTIENFQL